MVKSLIWLPWHCLLLILALRFCISLTSYWCILWRVAFSSISRVWMWTLWLLATSGYLLTHSDWHALQVANINLLLPHPQSFSRLTIIFQGQTGSSFRILSSWGIWIILCLDIFLPKSTSGLISPSEAEKLPSELFPDSWVLISQLS